MNKKNTGPNGSEPYKGEKKQKNKTEIGISELCGERTVDFESESAKGSAAKDK